MLKGIYTEVACVARKVKAGYTSVGGVARKVKAGYTSVDNIAREFWGDAGCLLYDHGDECVSITGSWDRKFTGYGDGNWWSGYSYIAEKASDHIYIDSYKYTSRAFIHLGTTNRINTTGYTKLCFDFEILRSGSDASFNFGLSQNMADPERDWVLRHKIADGVSPISRQVLTLTNIPQGTYYVAVSGMANYTEMESKIYKIWLE